MDRVLLEKPKVIQLVKKLLACYGTQRSITMFTRAPNWTLDPILGQINSVQTFPPYFPKIHSNITFPSTPTFSVWSLPFRFSHQHFLFILHLPMHVTCPTHLILLDLITLIMFGKEYIF